MFGITFAMTVALLWYSLYVVEGYPKQREVPLRRISIAELTGQLREEQLGVPGLTNNGPDRGSDQGPHQGSDQGTNQGPGQGPQRAPDNTADQRLSHGPVVGPERGTDTGGEPQRATNIVNQLEKQRSSPQGGPLELDRPSTGGPRIFCMVVTTVYNWATRARAVRDTWATRCDVARFFYSPQEGSSLLPASDAVPLRVPEGRDHLTAKTMAALRWAYGRYAANVDWFFKADDDTFVVMENLRFVAAQFKPDEPHYIGGRSADLLPHGYNGGGAGYLLSREAARLILEEGPKHMAKCKTDGGVEDLDIGACLETLKVYPIDTRDSMSRLTFHPDHPYKIFARQGDNARVYNYRLGNATYGNPQGIRTMSPHTVSFHYVQPPFMYMYDFLLYHIVRHREDGQPGHVPPLPSDWR